MTILWFLASRGWASAVQGGAVSDKTKRRQKIEFFVVLIAMYAVGFGMVLYAWLK